MEVYISLCIGNVEEDADIDLLAEKVAGAVAAKYAYLTVEVNEVEVA